VGVGDFDSVTVRSAIGVRVSVCVCVIQDNYRHPPYDISLSLVLSSEVIMTGCVCMVRVVRGKSVCCTSQFLRNGPNDEKGKEEKELTSWNDNKSRRYAKPSQTDKRDRDAPLRCGQQIGIP
jgi:hypothetical protein